MQACFYTKTQLGPCSKAYILDESLPHHEDTPSPLLHLKLYESSNPNSMAHSSHLHVQFKSRCYMSMSRLCTGGKRKKHRTNYFQVNYSRKCKRSTCHTKWI